KDKIGLEQKGGYELLSPANSHYLEEIEEINGLLKNQFSHPVFAESAKKLEEFKFGKTSHMVYNPFEGQLHSGKLIRSLWDYCNQLGVKTLTGTRVTSIDQNEGSVDVNTEEIRFSAKAVALCTNAFTKSLTKDHQLDITPGRGMVMLVESKEPIPFEGTFHYDEGYYYFRDYHGKVIFGGGRNLEIEKEQTSEFGINKNIEQKLLLDLQEVILPGGEFKVEMKWSGIMAFGATKEPVIKQLGSGLYLGVRLGGMGVALGSMVGNDLAAMLEKDHF
ncbi:MAG: FAD-dependent oxidoreductase, partial [Marinoscillum sp.]